MPERRRKALAMMSCVDDGVGAIIANDFARIFFRNAVNLGIPVFVAPEVVEAVKNGDEAELDLENSTLTVAGNMFELPELPGFAQEIIASGGISRYVREHGRFPGEAP